MLDNGGSVNNVRTACEHVFVSEIALLPQDLAFFSGFVAGDGSFVIRGNNAGASWCCGLVVKLRADDTPILKQFQEWTGSGQLSASQARGGSYPQTSWNVGRRSECLDVARMLDRRPLLGNPRASSTFGGALSTSGHPRAARRTQSRHSLPSFALFIAVRGPFRARLT